MAKPAEVQLDPKGWPINPPGVGMGPNSPWKLHEFKTIVEAHTAIVANINTGRIRRGDDPFPYYGLDPTAGPGGYIHAKNGQPNQELIGTSLLLARACHARALDYHLCFIEKEPDWVKALNQRLQEGAAHGKVDLQRVEVKEGRYELLARKWVVEHVPTYGARGLVIPDANGEFGYRTLCELGELKQLARVDFAIHASGALLKWRRGKGAIPLPDALKACHKTHWFVGQVRTNWQWVWLFGTNWPDWPTLSRIGLVSFESEPGQARLETLTLTESERHELHNPHLLGDA